MTLTLPRRTLLALGASALLCTTALAQEADPNAFAERLSAVFAAQGSPLRYEAATSEGSAVVLTDVRVGEPAEELSLGTLRFEDVTGSNAEGWRAERLPFEAVDSVRDDVTVTVDGAVMEGITIAPESAEPTATTFNAERVAIDALAVTRNGQEAFRLDGFTVANSPDQADGYLVDLAVESFVLDSSTGVDGQGAATMRQFGYEQLRGSVQGNGLWDTRTGELTLSPLLIAVEDAGDLSIAYSIAGYTPAFVQALTRAQQQMAANPENTGAGIAMMGLMAQLTVNSAEIAFADASLTNRVLDYYAGENNQTREQTIDGIVGALPAILGYLNNPQFQGEVSEAVADFLRDPGTLTIAVTPDEPVPASQVIGAALGAPQTLPAVLNLRVTATD